MKNFEIQFSWKFLAMVFLFSCGKTMKICKLGEANDIYQNFYITARSKCDITFQVKKFLPFNDKRNKNFLYG